MTQMKHKASETKLLQMIPDIMNHWITTTPMCWQVAKLLQTLISGSVSCVVPTNEYVKDELKPACWTFVIVSLVFGRRDSRTWQPKGGSTAEQLRKAAEVAAAAGSDAVNASDVWSVAPYASWNIGREGKNSPKVDASWQDWHIIST